MSSTQPTEQMPIEKIKYTDQEMITFLESYVNDLDPESVAELYTYLMSKECIYDEITDVYIAIV